MTDPTGTQVITPPVLLADQIEEMTGAVTHRCYQCGKCSAGCPMAVEMRLGPHDIMRLVNSNRRTDVLDDDSIWLCLACETCTARCPNDCDPAAVIDALRELSALAHPSAAPRRIRAFHRSFLAQIKASGRLYELGLVVQYKLRSGSLIKDAATAPGMMARGKLHARAHPIKGLDEIKHIFKACKAEGDHE